MKSYHANFYDLSERDMGKRTAAIAYFISDDTPNEEFLKQFYPPYEPPYSLKECWEGCAEVLCGRGIAALKDNLKDILLWWQDENWPGYSTIEKFVLQNELTFLPYIRESLSMARREGDIIWYKNLLNLLLKADEALTTEQTEIIEQILDYLEDDCWKDFDRKFTSYFL